MIDMPRIQAKRVRHGIRLLELVQEHGPADTGELVSVYREEASDGGLHPRDDSSEEPYSRRYVTDLLSELRVRLDMDWERVFKGSNGQAVRYYPFDKLTNGHRSTAIDFLCPNVGGRPPEALTMEENDD